MSNSEPRQRRIWRIHLSTTVLLTFVAALILYFNLTPRLDAQNVYVKGWPYSICYSYGFGRELIFRAYWDGSSISYLILNVLEAAVVLLATYCISEWLVRRREGRKT